MSKHPSPSTTPDPYRQVASSQPLFTDEAAKKSAPELPARRPTGPQFQYLSGPVYHDIWAIVLFLLNFAGFVVLTSIGLTALGAERTWSSEDVTVVDRTAEYVEPSAADKQSLITIVVTCAGAGIAMAFGYLLLMQRFAVTMIHASYLVTIGLVIASGILIIITGSFAGIFWIIIGGLYVWSYLVWRHRIPFTALIVETVCSITRQYSATFFVALVALGVQFAFSVWWAAGVLGLSTEGGTAGNLVFFLVFSYYWTSQVISNVVHVTISGLVGSWYFLNGTPSMPRNPVGGAARRALTTSFGPICFASLFVAAIQTTRFVLRQIARGHELLKAIVDCILACIESLVGYLTALGLVRVAVYGESFCSAAKNTADTLKKSGCDIIVSDVFVGRVLSVGSLGVGFAAGGLCYILGAATFSNSGPEKPMLMSYVLAAAGLCFALAYAAMIVVCRVIESATQTTLICLAEDPQTLARTKPQLYDEIKLVYPQIQWQV